MTTPVEQLLAKLPDAKPAGNGWSARCLAHEDRRASLSISEGEDGRALVYCHAGCKPDAICAAVGLTMRDLMPKGDKFPKPSEPNGKPRVVAEYNYRDEAGNVVFQVVRYEPKDFRQRQPKPGGGWEWRVKGLRVIPYRLCELLADPERPVFIVEGEKDADALAGFGLVVTCNTGGAGKWLAEHSEFMHGRIVFIIPDNDEAGRNHAQQVAQSLQGIAESVRIVELPGLPEKGDVSDWIAAGGTIEELMRLAEAAPIWTPTPAQPWPEIVSFDVLDLPKFPTHALPDVLRQWVEAESRATQTPADLAALLALAVCSVGIARRVVVEPRPGWREPVNLFAAVLLEPGNRKSAVFADAMKPLRELEAELIEAARPVVAREQSDRRQNETRLRRLEKLAAEKGDAHARHDAGILAAELAEQAEPVLPRLIVDDATAEKLGMMLDEQGGRIASMSPEGGVFDLMAGLYSKSGLPQFVVYLMGHSGDDLVTDRVGRKSVRVKRPALTCAYAIQPAVIEGLAENPAFRGRGLLGRFLYAAPQSWIGRREIAPAPVSEAAREAFRQAVRALARVEGEFVLQLSADAAGLLRDWESEIEAMLGDGGRMEIMRDWGAKLAGATLRLAAVLHCVEHGPAGRIDGRTIAAAIEIARYLVPHAETVLHLMIVREKMGEDDARYLLRWIERHNRREFTKSEAQHHGKRRFPKAGDIDQVLAELTRRGYIRLRPAEATGPGRPASPAYEVNPAAFADAKREKRSHNSRNSSDQTEDSNFGNNGSAMERSETTNRVRVTI
jgi:putative DNA primase/helicase